MHDRRATQANRMTTNPLSQIVVDTDGLRHIFIYDARGNIESDLILDEHVLNTLVSVQNECEDLAEQYGGTRSKQAAVPATRQPEVAGGRIRLTSVVPTRRIAGRLPNVWMRLTSVASRRMRLTSVAPVRLRSVGSIRTKFGKANLPKGAAVPHKAKPKAKGTARGTARAKPKAYALPGIWPSRGSATLVGPKAKATTEAKPAPRAPPPKPPAPPAKRPPKPPSPPRQQVPPPPKRTEPRIPPPAPPPPKRTASNASSSNQRAQHGSSNGWQRQRR